MGTSIDSFYLLKLGQQQQQSLSSSERFPTQEAAKAADKTDRGNTLQAVLIAVVAMTAYAFVTGLVEIKTKRRKDKDAKVESSRLFGEELPPT